MKRTLLLAGLAALLLTLGVSDAAHAQWRWVVVNGVPQGPAQLAVLDRHACALIPDGAYWLDYHTGIWGYAGDPRPQGHISDGCLRSSPAGRPSLSERGMLYSTTPWGRGR